MKIEELRDKKILLLGFGVEGRATLEFLNLFVPDSNIGIADQKEGPDYLEKQFLYDLVIRSPGVPKELIKKPYTTATNIFFANVKGEVIGVTGSKGKSTTASLIHDILLQALFKSHLCGNIGKPTLSVLMQSNNPDDVFVAELSSFQLDDVEYSPHISLILNLFPEHLDYHGSVENYWEAKKRIVKHALAEDYYIYNPKYSALLELSKQTKAKAVPFAQELPFSPQVIPLLGEHNQENVLAATTAAQILNIPPEQIERAVRNFKSLPHRLENIGTFRDITFYDDALATTPQSTIAAIKALPYIGTLFLGGLDRGYDFTELAKTLIEYKIPNVVLFPDSGSRILEALQGHKKLPNILQTSSLEAAVEFAFQSSSPGSICLLSTASPSFSLWKNYEEKGEQFQYFVKKIGSQLRA